MYEYLKIIGRNQSMFIRQTNRNFYPFMFFTSHLSHNSTKVIRAKYCHYHTIIK